MNPAEFVFTIDKSLQKLKTLSEEVVTTFVMPCVPLVTSKMMVKATYLKEEVKSMKPLKVITLEDIDHENDDIHPTEDGTPAILKQLHSKFGEEIIVDGAEEGDITIRKYSKVQSLNKVGCQ